MAGDIMIPAPSRVLQISCAIAALLGFLPWGLMFADTVIGAIESRSPLLMSVAAWFILLVPVWVIWFAIVAWRERNVSIKPAVLMAIPGLLFAALAVTVPFVSVAP